MGHDRHIFRRGAVWQWRRRLCGFSTGTFVLQLSLRTTDRWLACRLAREMSVECDRMLDKADYSALCQRELALWAKQIVSQKLNDLSRSRQIARTTASGPGAADNRLWNDAAIQAWNCIEADGINAEWQAHGAPKACPLSAAETDAGQRILNLLKESLKAPAKAAELRASFEAATGQSVSASEHVVQLMQTYVSAMAYAHRSVSDLEAGRAAGLRRLLDATRSEMVTKDNAAFSAETAHHEDFLQDAATRAEVVIAPSNSSVQGHSVRSTALQAPDPAIAAVVSRLMEEKKSDNLRAATITQYGFCIELFGKITGITDVRDVTQTAVSAFRDGLRSISNSYGKSLADKDLTYDQLRQKAASLPRDRVGLSSTTVNRHLDHIRQVLEKADSEGIILEHRINTAKLRLKERKRDRDKRAVFKADELEKVFQHTLWTGSASGARRHEVGAIITKDGQYWCPLIASVTGARLEEIAALTVSDIRCEDGITYFIFDENEIRDVKTEASR
ncbi:hypothetical protein SAMN04488003_1601 [Loktanella fryxellensis]|uniref:Core-binding (CB) domain-containing protein n=1 Tax=Loktanella fryxellensis TaxID=245187 RepID=A0A1H8KBJ6_9RHOB|nr:hypothetical protein [Loktanella fryxellensis]SEN90051.1 hypothetical protein SAMN04488003_1601 [Loktanella fryxellensis]